MALAGLTIGIAKWRAEQLRRDEVLSWANQTIDAINAIRILCGEEASRMDDGSRANRPFELAIQTSALIEKGRLFFRNQGAGSWSRDREAAYRGLRPEILDHVLVTHLIACEWSNASEKDRRRMSSLAKQRARAFVTRAQKEVGRSRTASPDVRRSGDSISLQSLLSEIDPIAGDQAVTIRPQ